MNELQIKEMAEAKYPEINRVSNGLVYHVNDMALANQDAFIEGYKTATVKYVPYQCCPICNGSGKVMVYPPMTVIQETCDVCNGAKIIPMHVLPTPPEI